MTDTTPIKGQLSLRYDNIHRHFEYILVYSQYPTYAPEAIAIENGDKLTVRNASDGSVMLERVIDFDFEALQTMDMHTGLYYQVVGNTPVHGIQKGMEAGYWVNLFIKGYIADLEKA